MSIEQTDVLDAISVDPETDEVVLTISDHLDWEDVSGHVYLLQEKVNAYLAFIESGEMGEVYPKGDGRRPRIDVVVKTEVLPEVKPVLAEIETALRVAGIGFRVAVLQGN